jgi:hypothetical protein
VRVPRAFPRAPRHPRADERRNRERQEQQQDRLQACEQDHGQRQLDDDADPDDRRAHRHVAPRALVPDELELVGVVGPLEVGEARRPVREAGDVAGQVDHVLVGDLHEEHVQEMRADCGEERKQRQEDGRPRRGAGVVRDDGVRHVLEHERHQGRARVAQEREREDCREPPGARAPRALQDRDEAAEERHVSNLAAWRRNSSA